jgi:hypothetical protein
MHLKTRYETSLQYVEVRRGGELGVVRDDIGNCAAVFDDSVDTLVRMNRLS